MLLHLLKKANALKWKLAVSLDVSAKFVHRDNAPDYPLDVHSWFFYKDSEEVDFSEEVHFSEEVNFSSNFSNFPQPSAPPMGWNFDNSISTGVSSNFTDLPPTYSQVVKN